MLDYQKEAINKVREYASTKNAEHQGIAEDFCKPFNVDVFALTDQILRRPVTINFQPDRFSNNGKIIIESLIEQGQYHGQFRTGTTNGGWTAYVGGDRFLWEQRLFSNAYPHDALDRPKYGALNLFKYADGASITFGSCFFVLKHDIKNRCTFAYGDSNNNPTTLCTSDTFIGILSEIIIEYLNKGKVLNQALLESKSGMLATLLNPRNELKDLGRNIDHCIETHIHGDILLERDVESFYVDGSFQNTYIGEQAEALCKKYNIALFWIPKRQIDIEIEINAIGSLLISPIIPLLAKKIDSQFGKQGFINAELIGRASRDSYLRPEVWKDMGSEPELFQYLKQLWRMVGLFG